MKIEIQTGRPKNRQYLTDQITPPDGIRQGNNKRKGAPWAEPQGEKGRGSTNPDDYVGWADKPSWIKTPPSREATRHLADDPSRLG